jgi:hypothetical protein
MYTLLLGLLYGILALTNSQAAETPVKMIEAIAVGIYLSLVIAAYLPASALVIGAIAGLLIGLLFARQTWPLSNARAIWLGIVGGSGPGLVLMWLIAKRLNLLSSLANANASYLVLFMMIPALLFFWSLVRVSLALNRSWRQWSKRSGSPAKLDG